MNGKYQPGQKVFLTGGNKNLENGGGVKVRESRIYPTRKEAEEAILNRKR